MTALLSSDGLRNLGELWYRKHDRDRVGRISEEKICRAAAYLNPCCSGVARYWSDSRGAAGEESSSNRLSRWGVGLRPIDWRENQRSGGRGDRSDQRVGWTREKESIDGKTTTKV